MQAGSKRISCSVRAQIENIKFNIRGATRPFDGDGYAFKTAIKELRKCGYTIKHHREKCHYTMTAP